MIWYFSSEYDSDQQAICEDVSALLIEFHIEINVISIAYYMVLELFVSKEVAQCKGTSSVQYQWIENCSGPPGKSSILHRKLISN